MTPRADPELPAALRVDYGREVELTRNPNQGIHVGEVVRSTRLTPTMVRVTLGGDEVRELTPAGPDQRVKIFLPADGLVWDGDPPTDAVPWALPRGSVRPRHRTYTARNLDPAAGTLDLDVALHDGGVGSAWAEQAAPGQRVSFIGPAGRWVLRPDTRHLVLVADETGLPAVAAILASLPPTVTARALVEVPGRASRQPTPSPAPAEVTWFHADEAPAAGATTGPGGPDRVDRLVEAAVGLGLHPDGVQVWGGAEQATIRAVRHHLLVDRGFTRDDVHLLAYWRRGVAEEAAFVDPREHHD